MSKKLNKVDALFSYMKDEFEMMVQFYIEEGEKLYPLFEQDYVSNFPKEKINQKFIFIANKYFYPGMMHIGKYGHQIEVGKALYQISKRFVEGQVMHKNEGEYIYNDVYQNGLEFAVLLLMDDKEMNPTDGFDSCPIDALSEEEYDKSKILKLKAIIKFIETDW